MDAARSSEHCRAEWNAAVDLANHVADGHRLPAVATPVLLDEGEVLHAEVTAQAWRYHAVDVTYTAPRSLAISGPLTVGLVAAGGAAARRRARRDAEAIAAPQWRSLGELRIFATDRRLLVWHDAAWASVWYNAIRELHPALAVGRLDLTFDDDPPYCLAGPWVPYLTVVVTAVLAQRRGVTAANDALHAHVTG